MCLCQLVVSTLTSCPSLPSGDLPFQDKRKNARVQAQLRRICEKKPSGKCWVSAEVHEAWKAGGHSRDELLDILINKASMDKACWVAGFVLKSPLCKIVWHLTLRFDNDCDHQVNPEDKFLNYVKKSYIKKSEEEHQLISGWYNEEQMATELKWSKQFGSISF